MLGLKEEVVVKVKTGTGDTAFVVLWFSSSDAITEDCDACVGYTCYDENKEEIDGGELEYDSEKKYTNSIDEAIEDILEYIYEEHYSDITYEITDLTSDDFE